MPTKKRKNTKKSSHHESGVDSLIKRLKSKGVDAGEKQATEIIATAQKEAKDILLKAKKSADKIVSSAEKKSIKLEKSTKEAIKIALRDSSLELKTNLQRAFINELKKIVKEEVADKKMIKKMILSIVENSSAKDKKEILIADPIKDGEKIKASLYGITKAMLKDGLELKTFASTERKGIIIKESKKGIEIDLSDKVLSDLLLDHLIPLYRDMLAGDK